MTTSNNQTFIVAEIVLKSKSDSSTKTIYLSNRVALNDTNFGRYIPIITSVSGIGVKSSDTLPVSSRGQLVLDNAPNSYGYQRRLSDFFERYTAIDQAVTIKIATTPLDDLNITADLSTIWVGRVVSHRQNFGKTPTLTFEISQESIARRVITKAIDSTAFPYAPESSLGQHIPVVIGNNVEVKAIPTMTGVSPQYAYSTTLGSTHISGGVQSYYVRDRDGVYRQVSSAPSVSTAVYEYTSSGSTTRHQYWNEDIEEAAYRFAVGSKYIVGTVSMLFHGTGNATWSGGSGDKVGAFIFKLYAHDPIGGGSSAGGPGELLASAMADKTIYETSFQGATSTTFWVTASFDKAVICAKDSYYWLSVSQTTNLGSTANEDLGPPARNSSASGIVRAYLFTDSARGRQKEKGWRIKTTAIYDKIFKIYGVTFTDYPNPGTSGTTDAEGLGHAYFQADLNPAIDPPDGILQSAPAIDELDIVVSVNGLKDDGSGTITGSASSVLTTAKHAIRALDREYNGSAWTGGRFDWTKLSGYHALGNRIIKGRTTGRTLLPDFISAICKSSASKIVQTNSSTPLAFYAWGTTSSPTVRLSQEDTVVLGVDQRGPETIINRLGLLYDKRVRDTDIVGIRTQDGRTDYAGYLNWRYSTNALTTTLSTRSQSLYGDRVLSGPEHEWAADSATAEELAKYYLSVFAFPSVYVSVEVPYLKYSTLEIMDVILIVTPELPGYFGTASSAPLPTYGTGSQDEVDLLLGNYLVRANEYRAQIEGKEFILGETDYPRLKLDLKLLLNYPADPT